MLQLLLKFLRLILVVYVFMLAYQWWKPVPEFMEGKVQTRRVPDSSVHFYADITYTDKIGKRVTDQHIWAQVERTIAQSRHSILLDMYLYSDFQGESPEKTKTLSHDLTEALIAKKAEDKHIAIALITDPINTVYGGVLSPYFEKMRTNGILIIFTDLTALPDSNLFYSAFWRPFYSWTGNSTKGGWLSHPFQYGGSKVTLRSWLALLNFKANDQKLIVADEPIIKGNIQVGQKIVTLITSADPHDGSSANGNVLLKVDDQTWKDVLENEGHIAQFSNSGLPLYNIGSVSDATGSLKVALYRNQLIKEKILELIEGSKMGDHLDLVMFYLSDRDVVRALVDAANRGVKTRIILDPNKDAFGKVKMGIPNQPVAKELINSSNDSIQLRWCDTHGEQCHAKLLMGSSATSSFMLLGSANFTRRNIGGYNLESDILVQGLGTFGAYKDANAYFEKMWANTGATSTTKYETYQDDTIWKASLYRIMEATGMSSF